MSRKKAPGGAFSNGLLALLPEAARNVLLQQAEAVELGVGRVLMKPGEPLRHAWFPQEAILALIHAAANGDAVQIAMIGNDGVLGLAALRGADTSPLEAVVLGAGGAFRVPMARLAEVVRVDAVARRILLQYGHSLVVQFAQAAVCNRHHTIDQQVARWLLMALDRLSGDDVRITQERIANLLGVRREGVTDAVRKLQTLGIVETSRGRIGVRDRRGLERVSCDCYAAIRAEAHHRLGRH